MPGISFLFWNVNRKPLEHRVARLQRTHSVDVVILAECATPPAVVSRTLNTDQAGTFRFVVGSGERLRLFSRLPAGCLQPIFREPLDAWLVFRMTAPGLPEFILPVAHLPSKLQTDEHDRMLTAYVLAADVGRLEEQEGHRRTVLLGDLNANPFEASVAGAGGLHGVMTRDTARRETRSVRGSDYLMFYNPMWGGFGDRTPGPPGTYYRSASASVNYFWNTYDQVLLRPAVMDRLAELRILDSDGVETLLTPSGLPDAADGSDHLPLFFRLDW